MQRRRAALIFIALLALGDAIAAIDLWMLWPLRHGDSPTVAAAVVAAPADPALSPTPPAGVMPPR